MESTVSVDADTVYLKLKGARERLCVAQMGDTLDDLDRMLLEEAVLRIDEVATKRCEQWSRFDRPLDPGITDE